jgi:hypothetical protein
MNVQYKNLILVIFNEQQLQNYQQKYYSGKLSLFDIANEMQAEAQEVIDSFDFLDFAETLMRQTAEGREHLQRRQQEEKWLQRM